MNKAHFAIAVTVLFSMVIFPLSSTADNSYMLIGNDKSKAVNATVIQSAAEPDDKTEYVMLRREASGKTEKADILEYLTGVCAAEIDADFETEAIKAQAVAAHTLMLYRKSENKKQDYDITDDSSKDQGYYDTAERRQRWGDKFSENESRLQSAISTVLDYTITYKDKPILSVYFDTSSGKTESAKNVWGSDIAYLQPVESAGDMLSPQYISTVTYQKSEFTAMAKSLNVTLSDDISKWFGTPVCSDSGTVLKISLGGKTFTGGEIRTAFNLRSANFDVEYSDEKIVFTVRGYGHGVGMSQYGANYMAKKGSTFSEILSWYYTNTQISG